MPTRRKPHASQTRRQEERSWTTPAADLGQGEGGACQTACRPAGLPRLPRLPRQPAQPACPDCLCLYCPHCLCCLSSQPAQPAPPALPRGRRRRSARRGDIEPGLPSAPRAPATELTGSLVVRHARTVGHARARRGPDAGAAGLPQRPWHSRQAGTAAAEGPEANPRLAPLCPALPCLALLCPALPCPDLSCPDCPSRLPFCPSHPSPAVYSRFSKVDQYPGNFELLKDIFSLG